MDVQTDVQKDVQLRRMGCAAHGWHRATGDDSSCWRTETRELT